MRDDEDNIRQYLPVLRRIIILVAVLTAIPVVMWTATAFVRSHISAPRPPALQPMAIAPSSAPADTTIVAASDQPPTQSANAAQATQPKVSATPTEGGAPFLPLPMRPRRAPHRPSKRLPLGRRQMRRRTMPRPRSRVRQMPPRLPRTAPRRTQRRTMARRSRPGRRTQRGQHRRRPRQTERRRAIRSPDRCRCRASALPVSRWREMCRCRNRGPKFRVVAQPNRRRPRSTGSRRSSTHRRRLSRPTAPAIRLASRPRSAERVQQRFRK